MYGTYNPFSFTNFCSFLAHLSWKLKWAILIACCPSSVCPSVCKLFTFSTSSLKLLGQFQPNLAGSIIRGWGWGFKFVQMMPQGSVLKGQKGENVLFRKKSCQKALERMILYYAWGTRKSSMKLLIRMAQYLAWSFLATRKFKFVQAKVSLT